MEDVRFTREELDLLRQWFDAVQDTQNPSAPYLVAADYRLATKLYEALGMRVPSDLIVGQYGGARGLCLGDLSRTQPIDSILGGNP